MADTPQPYLYEFLWRGRALGDNTPPAFHVIMAVDGQDEFGKPTHAEQIMNVEQAADAGIDLSTILTGLNASALATVNSLTASLASATADRDSARQERDDLAAQVSALEAQLNAVQPES